MSAGGQPRGGRYQWSGWTVSAAGSTDVSLGRLTETHEYFHRQLDDTTAFGGLVTTVATLAEARPEGRWVGVRDRLVSYSDLLHETFAVGASLLTTQREMAPVEGYPLYDRYVAALRQLVGAEIHPWVALAGLRAAATACMQSTGLRAAVLTGIERFDPATLPWFERPNHRLVVLLESGFSDAVGDAQREFERNHGHEAWWRGTEGVRLTPESMDGMPGVLSQALHRRLFTRAADALRERGAEVLEEHWHYEDLRALLETARELAPEGLARIGALVESGAQELMHGGALDSQTIALTAAPARGVVLPCRSISGLSGEGASCHGFLTLVRPERLRRSYRLEGINLPDVPALACLRTTVFDEDRRDCVLFALVDDPQTIEDEQVPIFVSMSSSAAAAAPELAATWMAFADVDRLSLIMDTPATAALRRWCDDEGARFRTATQLVSVAGMDVRIIAGRVEQGERRSALIVIPTTEFGARWFEAATAEDDLLRRAVQVDPNLFEEESDHLDVVLNHLLFEEHVVGTGSWRQ
jgi:hypothetical protein